MHTRTSLHRAAVNALLSEGGDGHTGSEAFDEFDQLYLSNHFNKLKRIHDLLNAGTAEADVVSKLQTTHDVAELEAEEMLKFYVMHREQVSGRLADSE